jgi:hypothetical protein
METTGYVSNNERYLQTDAGEFLMNQRNVGYWENDGRWIVRQLADLYWDGYGYLTKRREGLSIGPFDTEEEALTAIASAEIRPELEQHEILSGR